MNLVRAILVAVGTLLVLIAGALLYITVRTGVPGLDPGAIVDWMLSVLLAVLMAMGGVYIVLRAAFLESSG